MKVVFDNMEKYKDTDGKGLMVGGGGIIWVWGIKRHRGGGRVVYDIIDGWQNRWRQGELFQWLNDT